MIYRIKLSTPRPCQRTAALASWASGVPIDSRGFPGISFPPNSVSISQARYVITGLPTRITFQLLKKWAHQGIDGVRLKTHWVAGVEHTSAKCIFEFLETLALGAEHAANRRQCELHNASTRAMLGAEYIPEC